ncbi:MAG: hypothetical protein QMC81_06845 [Thermoanaerobacterales bacterium]|nr:hypothetical protein [Thermoanaerobacterales bacterium]
MTLFFLLFGGAGAAQGSEEPAAAQGRLVLVVLDRADLNDLKQLDLPAEMTRRLAWGLMNTNTGGARNVENTHATIGAGSRAIATGAGMEAYNAAEMLHNQTAAAEYLRRTGVEAAPGGVVHLGIAAVRSESARLPYTVRPGALGSALHAAGLRTAVFGNADWLGVARRPAALLAMDQRGYVDAGDVGRSLLTVDPAFPGILRTDYDKLWQAFQGSDQDMVVLDLGDLSRLDEGRQDVLPGVFATQRALALDRAGTFLGRVWETLDPDRDLLVVVVPTPPAQAIIEGSTLAPVIMAGAGVNGDTLTSASTRRPGIVLNIDMAPTVLRFFNLPQPSEMDGRPILAVAGGGFTAVEANGRQAVLAHNIRVPIIKGYMVTQLIVVGLVILALLVRETGFVRRLRLKTLLLAIMAFPAAALLIAARPYTSAPAAGLQLIIVTVAIAAAASALGRRRPLTAFTAIALFTVVLIITDLCLGAPLQKHSLLSYDPLGGARFYGLGNEYMGVLMGAVILSVASILTHVGPGRGVLPGVGLLLALVFVVTAHPQLGANFGGAVTAAVSFIAVFLTFAGVRFTYRTAFLGGVAAAAFIGAFITFDALRSPEQQTHIGRAARAVFGGGLTAGLQEAGDIIGRKVSMNVKLIRYTIWSRVFLASLAGLALLFFRPIGRMQAFRQRYRFLFHGLVGIIVASFVALVVNDSGIVAAATAMIFGAPPLMYYFLED